MSGYFSCLRTGPVRENGFLCWGFQSLTKGKNTCNTTKSNTTPVKPKYSTRARPEQPNIDEAEENDLKNNFKRMFETLKEEMRNYLKEMEENTNKKLKDISKSLKENQEKLIEV